MRDKERVEELLKALEKEMDNSLEMIAFEEYKHKLMNGFPKVKIIDDKQQCFNGHIYRKNSEGYYKRQEQLHRDVWEYHNGIIPEGHVIHHIDFNPENNNIDNLQLLTEKDHYKFHGKHRLKRVEKICPVCGKSFTVPTCHKDRQKCCSKDCGDKMKQKRVEKICAVCGKTFTVKFSHRNRQKHCSQSCRLKSHKI